MYLAAAMLTQVAAAGETVRGPVKVIDGATMIVAGQTVKLTNIIVPELGRRCIWRKRTFDCGNLARTALMDITAGANVICKAAKAGKHLCTADGYDLGFGMIHAGWAIPTAEAPPHYHRRMDQARRHKRMLWSAQSLDGVPEFALALSPD